MFQQNEGQFLKTFNTLQRDKSSSDSYDYLPKVQTPQARITITQPKVMYQENDCFSLGGKSQSDSNKAAKQKLQDQSNNGLGSSKRINHLKASQALSRNRKFSSVGIDQQLTKLLEARHQLARSQKSFSVDESIKKQSGEQKKHDEVPDIAEKNTQTLDSLQNFMKKTRNLETRIKNLCLKYETDQFKLKDDKHKSQEGLKIYEDHLQKYHPQILEIIRKKIEQAQQNRNNLNFFSDSSSSNSIQKPHSKDNSISMPVFSQLQQVRLDGKKLAQRLKSMETTVKELQKQIFMNRASQQNKSNSNMSKMLRKWSIPYNYSREKRQSFQTTINSAQQKQQKLSKNQSAPGAISQKQLGNKSSFLTKNPPPIKQYEIPEIPANSPVKFISERFIHVDNYEMDCQEEQIRKQGLKMIKQCKNCKEMKNFIIKINNKLKKLPSLSRNSSLKNLF